MKPEPLGVWLFCKFGFEVSVKAREIAEDCVVRNDDAFGYAIHLLGEVDWPRVAQRDDREGILLDFFFAVIADCGCDYSCCHSILLCREASSCV